MKANPSIVFQAFCQKNKIQLGALRASTKKNSVEQRRQLHHPQHKSVQVLKSHPGGDLLFL